MIEEKYHRIVIDGTPYYREYYLGSGRYGDDLYTEEELIELLLEEVVEDTIKVDHHKIECALQRIADHDDRNLIRNYLLFLERLMENGRLAHDISLRNLMTLLSRKEIAQAKPSGLMVSCQKGYRKTHDII